MMPENLVLVRHGQSEGNLANDRSRENERNGTIVHPFPTEFRDRHPSLWRLTKKGVEQATIAGEWLRSELNFTFDRFFVSTDLRARETGGLLALPGAKWETRSHLRECDLGVLELLPEERKKFPEDVRRREIDRFHGRPSGGESITDMDVRLNIVYDELNRKCARGSGLIVCHHGVMWTMKYRLERMLPDQFLSLFHSDDPLDHINNCQILHYTRVNPETGDETNTLGWMRSICPWDLSRSRNTWQRIKRVKFSNEELLAQVARVPRIIHD